MDELKTQSPMAQAMAQLQAQTPPAQTPGAAQPVQAPTLTVQGVDVPTAVQKALDAMQPLKRDIGATLAERGSRYGRFRDHAVIAQGIKEAMWNTPGWARLEADQKQAIEVISDKLARILNGDPNYVDNWHDIIGYAQLVEDRLTEPK